MKFRKKPVVIDAMEVPDAETLSLGCHCCDGLLDFVGESGYYIQGGILHIKTLEGTMVADPGDWIIKGVQGEFYPIKNDIFELTYEKVDEKSN